MLARSEPRPILRFGSFVFDAANARLYRGTEVLPVRGKTLAVLEYLAARPGVLVTKDELLKALWPGVYVSEHVLVGCVRELRTLFDDTRGAARFIETVYRRGYRWIAEVEQTSAECGAAAPTSSTQRPPAAVVGREADLALLDTCLARAREEVRQIVFVTGEAGIGKTALVDEFLRLLVARGETPTNVPTNSRTTCVVARGQCVEQYGPAEPFMPLLDALVRLGRQADHAWVGDILERCLPASMLPHNAGESPRGTLMPGRAVRMLAEAVEAIAAQRPFVLVIEDLHWSDPSTLDVLSYLAHRPDACPLLVLTTYRPIEVILRRHPVRALEQQLRVHGRSVSLPLGRLNVEDVAQWLTRRAADPPRPFIDWLYARTDGHPFFLKALLDALLAAAVIDAGDGVWSVRPQCADFGVPESVRLMVERQAEDLEPAERALLHAASASGTRFCAASVAAALEEDLVAVEARCDALADRGHFLRALELVQWPDGTSSGGYEFGHELYRSVLYDQLSPARARVLHQRIGRRLEQGYGTRANEVAAELALHFERARDAPSTLGYLEVAAEHCLRRGAHREAAGIYQRGLDVAAWLPATRDRSERELQLNLQLGGALLVGEYYADEAAERTLKRARDLSEELDAPAALLGALAGLHTFHCARAELDDAARILPRLLEIAQTIPLSATATPMADACAAWGSWCRGDFHTGCAHASRVLATAQPEWGLYIDAVSFVQPVAAILEMVVGNLDVATQRAREGVARVSSARSVDRATTFALTALFHICMGELPAAARTAQEAIEVAEPAGYRQWLAVARFIAAWTAAMQEPSRARLAALSPAIDAYVTTGVRAHLSMFTCLAAEAHVNGDQPRAAQRFLEQAAQHVRTTGERWYEAELHRLQGACIQSQDPQQAETSFRRAIEIARAQGAKWWELRASLALANLWTRERQRNAARQMLHPLLREFGDHLTAPPDLVAARTLAGTP